MDSGLIVLAAAARAAVLIALGFLLPHTGGASNDRVFAALEVIADVGVIGTAIIYTLFDLIGAALDAYKHLKARLVATAEDGGAYGA